MYLRNRRLLSTIVLSALWCSACWPQDIASDFQQAFQTVRQKAGGLRVFLSFHDVNEAATGFVAVHSGTAAAEFLQSRVADPDTGKLALLCLAKLAAANKAAEDALVSLIYQSPQLSRSPRCGSRSGCPLTFGPEPAVGLPARHQPGYEHPDDPRKDQRYRPGKELVQVLDGEPVHRHRHAGEPRKEE